MIKHFAMILYMINGMGLIVLAFLLFPYYVSIPMSIVITLFAAFVINYVLYKQG